jgi:hypothetical protein
MKRLVWKRFMMPRTGLQILNATVGVEFDTPRLLPHFPLKVEVPSLLTDFRNVLAVPFTRGLDGKIVLEQTPSSRWLYRRAGRTARFRGPLLAAERKASDLRYSLWGNQGFLYRFVLYLLELRHAVYSFHAAGLYDELRHALYVVAGGAGSGKTVYLLSGLMRGLKLFSTETVHFQLEKRGVIWSKGSLVDNIRLGTLIQDFPQFCPPDVARLSGDAIWRKKIALDLGRHQSEQDTLDNPDVVLIFPRIEEGRPGFVATPMADRRISAKAVFDNISQKIAETFVLYDALAVPGFETSALAEARWRAAASLVAHPSTRTAVAVLSNPAQCWGDLTER